MYEDVISVGERWIETYEFKRIGLIIDLKKRQNRIEGINAK